MWRQTRTVTLVMLLLMLFIVKVGLTTFNSAGGALGMTSFLALIRNPAMMALYGRATSLSTAGAFVAWRMGMYLALGAALWSGLMATKLTRAGEDDETWDLLVVGVTGRKAALGTAISVVGEAGIAVGAVVWLTLLTGSQSADQSLLFAAAITGVAWIAGAIGLLCAQLFAPRRSASQVALVAVGLLFLLRMIADGATTNEWLRWLTPFGWLENADAFGVRSPFWVVPLLAVPVVLCALAWGVESMRDIGGAPWVRSDRARAHQGLLRSPWRFAWRERRSTLVTWAIGLSTVGVVVGYLANALVSFSRSNPSYVRLLDRWGYGSMITVKGFVGEICLIMALAMTFLVVTLVVMVAADGLAGRLDVPFSTGVRRATWLVSSLVATLAGVVTVALVSGVAMWAGVQLSGTSVSIVEPMKGMLNAATVAPLIVGASALVVAWVPRFAYVAIAALLAVWYVISMLGPILRWPGWLLDASPFHFLHLVPTAPPNWGATAVFLALGVVMTMLALHRYERADVGR